MASSMLTAEVSVSGPKEAEMDKALKAASHACANDPDFAVVCDFLQKFSKDLGIELPNFKLLLQWLTKSDEVSPQLRDMQIKLLRKTRKTVHERSWESALSKFCFTYSAQDGWEIERFGYKNASAKVKLRILRELLECQFERNTKFRSKILTISADTLRSKPIGRDRQGHSYWVTKDNDCNIRIYQEHLDDEIWQVVATNREEFVHLLKLLKGREVIKPCEDIGKIDEDTTSSSSNMDSISVQKVLPPEEKSDSHQDEQKVPKLSIKLAFGKSSKDMLSAKDVGKGEEELAADEDAKLLQKTNLKIENEEEEFEEIEEEFEDESDSEAESEDQIIKEKKPQNYSVTEQKPLKDFQSKEPNKKVEPLLISQKKIVKQETKSTFPNNGKKRTLDEKKSISSFKNDVPKKFRSSLSPSLQSKSVDKNEGSEKGQKRKESTEENDEVEEEIEEEDIDSVAAEEDENEEKMFEDYDDEDEEVVGEEITDPIVKVVGEGSGKECNVGNYLRYIDYDSDDFTMPISSDTIVEDVQYVYGEGSGNMCLVGNKNSEDDAVKMEKVHLNPSVEVTETNSDTQAEMSVPEKGKSDNDNKFDKSANSVPNDDNTKNVKEKDVNDKETLTKDLNCSSENGKNVAKQSFSTREINDINGEKQFASTTTVDQLNFSSNTGEGNDNLTANKKPDDKELLETTKTLNLKSTELVTSGQHTHASKMSALESVKKELRESKQKLLGKKLLQAGESGNVKPSSKSIYNRKRRFSNQIQKSAVQRPPNSESEVDLNSENNEDFTYNKELEIVESDQDIGGKRIKMRPKQIKTEFRKKIEAQKVAEKEETTSSSGGEDELRKQNKIICSKQSLTNECTKSEKNELAKVLPESVKEENKPRCTALNKKMEQTKTPKAKPTLAEIIEKKLKRTPEKCQSAAASADKDFNEEVDISKNILPSPKKSPITKPLKKNVLIQIRQEANDDEVPRKRCNSKEVDINEKEPAGTLPKEVEGKATSPKPDIEKQRNTLERQRKRRSSEETVHNENAEEPEAKKEVTTVEEELTLKRDKTNGKEDAAKVELKDLLIPEEKSLPVPGRRSARRGGIIKKCTETSLTKRNRSSSKDLKECKDLERIESESKENNNTESAEHLNDPETGVNKGVADILQKSSSSPNSQENETKDFQIKSNPNMVEKSTKVEGEDLKTNLNPKTPTRGTRKQREVDATNIIDVDSETPVRQSRRIAQQKIREEAERRKLEEIALRTMKQELKKKKKAEKEADPTIAPPTEPSSESEESDVEIKRKLQKKKLPGKNGNWSSGSEEQEEPEEEDEEPHRYETDPGTPLFKSDHEFSPESEIEDESQVVPMKRARTVRKEDADGDATTIYEEEEACQKCNKSDHPEWILLCDNCDKGYHCSCLSPVLFYIPEGEWYCPPCQQEQLIKALEIQLKEFDDLVENKKKKEEDEKRLAEEEKARQEKEEQNKCKTKQVKKINSSKNSHDSNSEDNSRRRDEDDDETTSNSDDSKSRNLKKSDKRYQRDRRLNARSRRNRLKKHESDSESGSNQHSGKSKKSVSRTSSSSSSTYSESDDEPIYKLRKRRQINVSYRLNEYDDLINSALKKEMDEVAGAGNLGRGKDISTIIEADKEEKARQKQIKEDEISPIKKEINGQEKEENSSETKPNDSAHKIKTEEEKKEESDSDAEPIIRKLNIKPSQKKKSRKLTTLDISSEDDDGSDEDFKGSSIDDDDDEEDTSVSASNSDSSLEVYKKRGKFKKKRRKAARKVFRERRRDRKFLVDESDDEEVQRPKSKKKRKDDSEYTESEADDDEISDLSENIDSADLCDDTTTDESDGAWRPNKRKKSKKSTNSAAQKTSKPKISHTKKPKKVEYSDDDVSDSDEDEDDDDEVGGSGKGYGKQPRSQPLKKTTSSSSKTKGKGKEKPPSKPRKNKSSEDESNQSNSEDSTRRTRGRRYAYIEDFDDDSSDGGIKPGVQRPDTPPEEREKFIKRQEEIKRMLAEKNAEGAKLAATPRLTPIKTENDKKSPAKSGTDSLSTVPLSVIRQAKVLDIDYLQRRGENLDDLSTEVAEVDDDFDDADLPDDLPEDMDEDAIARMVEEEEEFAVAAAKELPTSDETARSSNATKLTKTKEIEKSVLSEDSSTRLSQTNEPIIPVTLPTPSTILQEPVRKRLPMPTMHPPLLRHQYLMHESMSNTHHLIQRQAGPPTSHLLQNALSAPLSQPLGRNFQSQSLSSPHHSLINRMPSSIPLQSTHSISTAATSPSSSTPINTKPSPLNDRAPQEKSTNPQNFSENKPRGRRKKITPLRDTLQKQQTAAAVAAAAATSSALNSSFLKQNESPLSSIIKSGSAQKSQVQTNALGNMQHTAHAPACRPGVPMAPIRVPYGTDGPRFFEALGGRSQQPGLQRHRAPSQMPPSLLPPQPANRSSYGPPPPLKGSSSTSPVSSSPNTSATIRNPMQHIPPPYLGMPPNARHAPQLNIYRAPIYGNPNFGPRSGLRSPNVHSPDFSPSSRAYPPYGFYPPPPPLTVPCQRPVSTSRTSTQIPPVQSNIVHPSTSVIVSSKSLTNSSMSSKNAPPLIPEVTGSSSSLKQVSVKKEFSIRTSPKPPSPTNVITQAEKVDTVALTATVPKKKLTTLQTYTSSTCKKSPVLQVSDSSGSRSPNNSSTRINDEIPAVGSSEVQPPDEQSTSKEDKASEFSGLVSYFSSQHDDYNT